MNIRFYNARILTMAEPIDVFMGELLTEGNKIAFVGDAAAAKQYLEEREKAGKKLSLEREIDCKANLIMPGFKNAHTHSGMTFLRSIADDMPLLDWLHKQIFPREDLVTAEDLIPLTKLANLEYLTSGITACFDMYLDNDAVAEACEETGMRCVQVGGINDFTSDYTKVERAYLKLNTDKESLNSYVIGFHAEYTTSEERLHYIADLAKKYKAPVYAHNSETYEEVCSCKEHTGGLTPTQYLDSLGIYDYGGGGYHCVYMDDKDIEIFKKHKLSIVTNPASNLKLASGIAPVDRFVKEGINVAIGTDGPASNNCLDFFREMFLVTGLSKVREKDAAVMDANDVLRMATVGGAKAMFLDDCDILAEGKKADLIMIDLNQPNMQPINNITKNIVYAGSKQNVALTMINGKILYEKGEFNLGEDVEGIYAKVTAIRDRIIAAT